eukprot:364013-Chlamydomonas_euryale.AAC.8
MAASYLTAERPHSALPRPHIPYLPASSKCFVYNCNWYHPLGFAYYPDGAHEGVDEVEDDSLVYLINGVQDVHACQKRDRCNVTGVHAGGT